MANFVGVLDRANVLAQTVAQVVGSKGEQGAFWQSFDAAPEEDGTQVEFTQEHLTRAQARHLIAERVRGGFIGLAAFTCLEWNPLHLHVEVFDTREPPAEAPKAARSVVLSLPLKKTWTGKLKAGSQGQLRGDAEPLPL